LASSIAEGAYGLAEIFENINRGPKKVTICASETKPNPRGKAPIPNEEHHCQKGKGDEKDGFGKVAASRLSPF